MTADPLIISENYRWHEAERQFEDVRQSGHREADDSYVARVNVFEDRVHTWTLDVVRTLLNDKPSPGDYVALSALLAYVEGIEQFRQGQRTPKSHAREWFANSLKRILPHASDPVAKHLWSEVRNGLFHDGFTRGKTVVSRDSSDAASCEDSTLRINPVAFAARVEDDFRKYVEELRVGDPSAGLAKHFNSLWDKLWEES